MLELWPFSQGEQRGRMETFVHTMFSDDDTPLTESAVSRADYIHMIVAGGYPEAVERVGRRRATWFNSYVKTVIERESKEVLDTDRGGDIVRMMRHVAARHAGLINVADLARDAGLAERTTHRYLHLLESVFLVTRTPAWWTNLSGQLTKASKLLVSDSGLAAYLRRADESSLARPETAAGAEGPLFEGFVLGELRRQLSWAATSAELYHFRD